MGWGRGQAKEKESEMRKILGSLRRTSPPAIIALIALFVALGGTAIAGGVLTTKQFKKLPPVLIVSENSLRSLPRDVTW